ncbi:MAG: ABC transporter ATP-binding protein [Candidatus Bathyarchaeia archaeon]
MPATLEVKNVKKTYHLGKVLVPALRGVTFDVEAGEFLSIFGPSGSGKSTLLNILGCLTRPDEGAVTIDGEDALRLNSDALAHLRLTKIGFIFQFFNLLPKISALQNVALPLHIAGLPEEEAEAKAMDMLRLVGLEQRAKHRPYELSGGEQQRVATARALVNDPKIVLADEPTGNLDTATGKEVMALMRQLNREKGQTFVVITHDSSVADVSDRMVFLRDGLIEAVRTPDGRAKT